MWVSEDYTPPETVHVKFAEFVSILKCGGLPLLLHFSLDTHPISLPSIFPPFVHFHSFHHRIQAKAVAESEHTASLAAIEALKAEGRRVEEDALAVSGMASA